MEPSNRASALVYSMDSVARQDCLSAGGDQIDNNGCAMCMLGKLRYYFAPEAAGSLFQEAVGFSQFRGADLTVDEYIVEFGLLRRKAESRMEMGAGFPEQYLYLAHAERGASSVREVAGVGQQPEGPEVFGCGGGYADIIWITRRSDPPGRHDCRGRGWAPGRR